ncbi:MAG: choice-of-anchor D domain-containing protein [Planctomycetes bacterium]|nr:choice-of-anchor D domain-containing protein [Planctomycetota bacterium]
MGVAATGASSPPLYVWLFNVGGSSISLGTIAISGANPADFFVDIPPLHNPLGAQQETFFTIKCLSATPGVKTATIEIPHNASSPNPFRINVTCNVYVYTPPTSPPVIQVNLGAANGPLIAHQSSPSGTPRDFGDWDILNGATAPITIFVTNAGTGTLYIGSPQMGGTWSTEYVVNKTGTGVAVNPGQSTSFTVAFDPSSPGQKNAYVRIPHNDTTQAAPFQIPVTGNATTTLPFMYIHLGPLPVGPVIPVGGFVNTATAVAGQGKSLTFTVANSNYGGGSLNLTGTPAVAIGNEVQCTAVISTNVSTTTISPGGSTNFVVDVTPAAPGFFSFTLSLDNNDPSHTPYSFTITGWATAAPASSGGSDSSDDSSCSTSTRTNLFVPALALFALAVVARRRKAARN